MLLRYCCGQAMPRSFARRAATLAMRSLSKSGATATFANASSNACTRMRRLPRPTTSFSPPGHRTTSEWQSAQLCTRNGTWVFGSSVRCRPSGRPSRSSRSALSGTARRWVKPKRSASACGVAPRSSGCISRSARKIGYGRPVRYGSPMPVRSKMASPSFSVARSMRYSSGLDQVTSTFTGAEAGAEVASGPTCAVLPHA